MFLTAEELKLSQNEIDRIVEELWEERFHPSGDNSCHDCGVDPGEVHEMGCDVAHCLNCGSQTIFADCCEEPLNGQWSGIWPGVDECYKKKYICFDVYRLTSEEYIGWCFDLNRLAEEKMFKKNEKNDRIKLNKTT